MELLDLYLPIITIQIVTDFPLKTLESLTILFLSCNFMNILSHNYNCAIGIQSQYTVEKKLNIFKDQNSMLDDGNNITKFV